MDDLLQLLQESWFSPAIALVSLVASAASLAYARASARAAKRQAEAAEAVNRKAKEQEKASQSPSAEIHGAVYSDADELTYKVVLVAAKDGSICDLHTLQAAPGQFITLYAHGTEFTGYERLEIKPPISLRHGDRQLERIQVRIGVGGSEAGHRPVRLRFTGTRRDSTRSVTEATVVLERKM